MTPAARLHRIFAGLLTALIAGAGLLVAGGLTPAAGDPSRQLPLECATSHWVAAWTADPSGALPTSFADQTLRVILTPHIGGRELRVHVSNRFGRQPVTFTRASVALRRSGAALVPGSSSPVTFSGAAGVTVAPGGEAVSDPAPLTFGAFQDLAVSLYLAGATGPATGHYVGRERSYSTVSGSGDHTGEPAAGAFADSTTMVDYVDAVDVMAPTQVGAAVLFGDSITDGFESTSSATGEEQGGIDLNHRFPDYLARRLLAEPGSPRASVLNAGISGNRLLVDAQAGLGGASGLARLDKDVLGVAGVSDVIVLEGINDISAPASAGEVTTALAQIVARLHAAGLRVQLGTIIPAGTGLLNLGSLLPAVYLDSPGNAVRAAVNSWIRGGASGADGIVDFDAALRGAAQPNELDPGFDSGDHIHPNDRGYSRMADAVNLATLGGAFCAASSRLGTTLRVLTRARPAGHLRLTGSVAGAGPTDCTGTQVIVHVLHGGHTILKAHLPVAPTCRFAVTRAIGVRGRLEVRASFSGSPSLLPEHARSAYLLAG